MQDEIQYLCAQLKRASAAAAYEAMDKQGDLSPLIKAMVKDVLCVGTAYTVRAPAGYGDEIVLAADNAPAGSVIVIDIGAQTACSWGGTGTAIAARRGISGVVSNGFVRDVAEIRHAKFPVFAQGTVVSGWRKGRSGETGVPVTVGGQIVHSGDIVCADDNGVVVIPQTQAGKFLRQLEARLHFEAEADRIVQSGGSYAQVMASKLD